MTLRPTSSRWAAAPALLALAAACVGLPARAEELDGRYVGSFVRTVGTTTEDFVRQRYDLGTRSATPGGLDMELRMSLQHQVRPDLGHTGVLRSRFFGDLRSPTWRLRGQLVPWQDVRAGANSPREQTMQVGLDLLPRNAPRLSLDFTRLDRDINSLRSSSDDRRALLSYERGWLGTELRWRKLDARPDPGRLPTASTQEWGAALHGARSFGGITTQAAYDLLLSRYRSGERRRDLDTQQFDLRSTWNVSRRVTLGASGLERWGQADDNALGAERAIRDRTLSAHADYRPIDPLNLQVLREHRRTRGTGTDLISDYLRLQALLRQALLRDFTLQTGYLHSIDLNSKNGEIPQTTAYTLVDGLLRRGLEARGELRASRTVGSSHLGTQWVRMLQLRTHPTARSRFETSWRRDDLPRLEGRAQQDDQWEFTTGYELSPGSSLVGSYRLLDGQGRIDRDERLGTVNGTWRTGNRTSIGANWSDRRSTTQGLRLRETVTGSELTFYLPGEVRLHGSWTRSSGSRRARADSFNLVLDKVF